MHFDWKTFAKFGLAIASAAVPQIAVVENLARSLPGLHGKDKQDAVVALVKSSLEAAEGITDKDLLSDPDVEVATRGVIDAVVALHNIVELKKQKPPVPEAA